MDAVQSSISRRERPVAPLGQLQTEPTLCLCKLRHERGDLNSKKQFEHFCTDFAEFMAYREGEVTQYLGRYLWNPILNEMLNYMVAGLDLSQTPRVVTRKKGASWEKDSSCGC